MKKTLVTVLVVVALVLALGIAGAVGFVWYRNNHIFVEGDAYDITVQNLDLTGEDVSVAYYEELKAQLPDCQIRWMVPFQDGKYPNDTEKLVLKNLSLEGVEFIVKYFPNLKELDLTQCHNYDVLAVAEATLTDCEVQYFVNLGHSGHIRDHKDDVIQLEFLNDVENESYDFEALLKNLVYFPELKQLVLKNVAYSLEQVESLKAAYPEIEITATVEILGLEYGMEVTELDLSGMTGEDAVLAAEQIKKLPDLTYVNLNPENGIGALSLEDVKQLMEEQHIQPNELVSFGDGYVEIELVANLGGLAIGAATNEETRKGINEWKRDRLISAGANAIIPDFRNAEEIIEKICQ